MANVKISELVASDVLVGDEILPIVQGGITKKVTVSQIVDNVDSYTKSESDVIFDTKVDKVTGSSLVEDTKVTAYDNHIVNTENPHGVTKAQIGLGNVDNTSDLNKPISTATQNALDTKVSNIVSVLPNGVNFDTLIDTAIYEGEITTSTGSPTGLGYFSGRVEITRTGHITNPNIIQKAYSKADGKAYVRVRQNSIWGEWSSGISQTLADKIVNTYTKSETNTLLNAKEDTANKGVPNGYASLDLNGKVPLTQISDSILGQLEYMGVWDFTTLPTATQKGQYWVSSVAGNGYEVGDWAVYNGTTFDKVDNTDAVSSVAGRTGNVVLGISDITNLQSTLDGKSPTVHTHDISDVTNLQTALDSKVAKVTSTDNAIVRFDGTSGAVQNSSVVITDSGNVGIGTNAPAQAMHIKSNSGSQIIAESDQTIASVVLKSSNSGLYYNGMYNTGNHLYFKSNNVERLRIDSSGDVGIGTAPDGERLKVFATIPNGTLKHAFMFQNSNTDGLSGGMLLQSFLPRFTMNDMSTSSGWFDWRVDSTTLKLGYGANTDLFTRINECISITSNGYTKLGSDAPAIKYKKLTGTTPATEGGTTVIAHGLNASKIISINALVQWGGAGELTTVGDTTTGYQFYCFTDATKINLRLHPTTSEGLLSKPFTVLICYEE